jgi:Ca-activated chloride channel family protein
MSAWFNQPLFKTPAGELRFADGYILLILLLLPVLYYAMLWVERHRSATVWYPMTPVVRRIAGLASGETARRFLALLRVGALSLMILALAQPQFGRVERQVFTEGIDIMLVLDVSLSMRTTDFVPNRLEAAKVVVRDFVAGRVGDRIGLVIFGSEPAVLVPLTFDYGVLQSFIERIQFNLVDGQSTAIGNGLATSLKKILESDGKSRIIILLTDGENNAGNVDPLVAAEAARASKVRVYTIGVGSQAGRWSPLGGMGEAGLDEETLKAIADMTGGLYFRATDKEKLSQIYAQIDKLEKSRVEATQFDNFNELAPMFLMAALVLLGVEMLLKSTRFVKIP